MTDSKVVSSLSRGLYLVFALLLCMATAPARAQLPDVAIDGLPATPLLAQEFCTDLAFSNLDVDTGFGPYLVLVFEPGIENLSVDFINIPARVQEIGVFGADGTLVDPISEQVLMGVEGGRAFTVRYPLGSVDQGQPALAVTACASVAVGEPINVDKVIQVIPGFEFGDTSTGVNGAITGAPQQSTVTPQLARVAKSNTAPEGERPPGPSHPFQYQWTVDISLGESIENLLLEDNLPTAIQWTGAPVTVSAPLGAGCAVDQTPNLPVDGTGGTVRVSCDAVLGNGGGDVVVSVPVYVSDVLDQGIADSESISNTVTFDALYQGTALPQGSGSSTVQAVHAALQKSVSGTGLPGGLLTYALNFQLTDYSDAAPGAGGFLIRDTVADGLRYDRTVALILNGTSVPITPTVTPGPGPGQTTLEWDIAAAAGGSLSNGASGSITFETTILDSYSNGNPVLSSDRFPNTATLDFALNDGGSGSNSSSITQSIQPNDSGKSIVSPDPLPDSLRPGDAITFELSIDVRAGNTANVVFTDFLPRPVFSVADFDESTDLSILTPFRTLTPNVTVDAGTNSIRLDFGDVSTGLATTLRVQLTARVVGTPFADDLFLTNLLSTSYENTDGDVIQNLEAVSLNVGAPSLEITKGVIAADNPNASITPAPPSDPGASTADSNVSGVDAFDEITYLITVENIGSAPAFNVRVDDLPAPGLSCAEPGPGAAVDGSGNPLTFSGSLATGIRLDQPLAANDGSPGAPYADDTALLSVRCSLAASVEGRQTLTNEAGATWTATADATVPFERISDTAEATIADPGIAKSITAIAPGYSSGVREAHIGEILTYELVVTVPEGRFSAVRVEDTLDNGLAFVDVLSITADSPALSTSRGSFADVLASAGLSASGSGETAPDRRLIFGPTNSDNGFGTITNSDSDNNSAETITISYRAKVLNAQVNVAGQQRRNRARWLWQPAGEGRRNVQVRSRPVRIVEPLLQLNKLFTPREGDESSPPRVRLTLSHRGGSSADAFDMALADPLPGNLRVDGAITTSACTNPPDSITVSDLGSADGINATWSNFPLGARCTLSFQTRFDVNPLAGDQLRNCAEVAWESLSNVDQPLPMPPSNSLGVERTGNATDPGQRNNYAVQACDTFSVFGVGISKRVIGSNQGHTDNIPGTPAGFESLTIGEEVTFELVVTIPETDIDGLVISDLLPVTSNVLEMLSAQTTLVGADVDAEFTDPAPQFLDRDGDGIDDTVRLDYGEIIKITDGMIDDDDRIRIEIVAKVRDALVNRNNDTTANVGVARFAQLTDADDAALEIVEPLLALEKTADRSEAEAGNAITYTLAVQHSSASRIDAKDLVLRDLVPANLSVIPGSIDLGGVCSDAPDTAPTFSGGEIQADWTTFPLSAVCEITYQATVDVSAVIGQPIVNDAEIRWTTLDTSGDPDDRSYDLSDSWTLTISEPGLDKALTSTDVDATAFVLGAASQDLTIGETATFTLTAEFSDGTTQNVNVLDQLPSAGVALEITAARLVSIGADLTLSGSVGIGNGGTDCSGGGRQTCVEWSLGDVVNLPDLRPDPDPDDAIVFEVDALVLDDPLNSGAPGEDKNLLNEAFLTGTNVAKRATAAFNLVEPQLEFSKLTENGDLPALIGAGQTHRFTLIINHRADSTATAVDLRISDELDANILWVDDSAVSSDCPDFLIDSTPAPDSSGTLSFSIGELELNRGRCEISYDVRARGGLPLPGRFPNTADLDWYSAPLPNAESRPGRESDENSLFSTAEANISKVVTGTSVPDTGTAIGAPLLDDLAIGERVSYRIVAAFDEGSIDNVVITDTLESAADPNGPMLEFVTGNAIFIGDNISITTDGTAVPGPGNSIVLDLGTVTNNADLVNDANDTIVFELVARVIDLANNVSGVTLNNTIELTADGGVTESADVDIEVVEPVINASKTFTDLTEGVATISIEMDNSGNSAAYELTFTDQFDDSLWLPGSLVPIDVPPGFTLSENTAGGFITVTLATAGNPGKPEEVLAPGETVTVEFSMELVNGGIVGVTQIDNTVNVEATSLPGDDPGERTYTTDATDSLFFPDLALEKTWNGPSFPGPASPGDTLTYTLTLANTGLADATVVAITDVPDSIGEFIAGSVTASGAGVVVDGNAPGDSELNVAYATLGAGNTVTVSYQVRVPLPYPNGQTAPQLLSNQANADSKEQQGIVSDDPGTTDPDDPTVVDIVADPVMLISKDDQVALTAPGATIRYRIDYGNVGNQDATGVVISETVPANTLFSALGSTAGWSCPPRSGPGTRCDFTVGNLSLAPGSVIFAVQVDDPLDAGVDEIINTVDISDDGIEFDGSTPVPSTDTAMEQTPIGGALPQLTIDKDDGGIGVSPGQRYSYQIDYANIGNQGATGVVITETVPEDVVFSATGSLPTRWSCPDRSPPGTVCSITVPLLPARSNDQLSFGLDVLAPAAAGRNVIFNTVQITDDGANSLQPSTDSAADDTPLIASPDIFVSKRADVNIVDEGESIVYTAEYGNQGNQNATGVIIQETVPAGAVFNRSASAPSLWSCSNGAVAGTICNANGGLLVAGVSRTLTFAVDVVETPRSRSIINVILAGDDGSNGADPTPENNQDTVTTPFPAPLVVDTMGRGALLALAVLMLLAGLRQRQLMHSRR